MNIGFLIGALLGIGFGVVIMCLLTASSSADQRADKLHQSQQTNFIKENESNHDH